MTALFPDGVFFVEWPTWARLAIILGGLLTITLITGFCVKLRNWRKNIKLERRAAEEEAERGEVTLVSRSSDDIPFGIRALLEDSEVEGVWNSRNVTPLNYDPVEHDRATTFLQSTALPKEDSSTLSNCLYDPADIGLAATGDRDPVTDYTAMMELPAGVSSSKRKKKTLIISYNGPHIRSESAGTVPAVHSPVTQVIPGSSPSKMHLRPCSDQPSSGGRRFVIGSRQKNSLGYKRADLQSDIHSLERMEAHRQFHAAESGQLLPKDRRHTDLVLTTPLAPSVSDGEENDSYSARALSWPARMEDSMQLGKRLSRKAQRREGPRPVPFRAFVESLPPTKAPPSSWTQKTQAKLDVNIPTSSTGSDANSKTSSHTPKSSISSSATSSPTSPTDSISIANIRTRKINDGFEVLPAGTLTRGPSVKEFGLWPENVKVANKPNKLRKLSRSNPASGRSSTESRRLSDESFRLPIF
ncbi:hypothetical protein A1O3_05886 [Capronia epimyces CBS 606.96]|uniref:Uncharacterized protein n=1 Tax=Capronia epimyces CBS 606.96 TaxID=1182542 RepID=W9Y7H9_9EURO|nr:uncharacterized protein A1O3_05886 [Capronia epimyces CBS 606.96]EXJ85211.1 hypothetical protein A1O3_05886 [Capronia epimyces CBS 606.96]